MTPDNFEYFAGRVRAKATGANVHQINNNLGIIRVALELGAADPVLKAKYADALVKAQLEIRQQTGVSM